MRPESFLEELILCIEGRGRNKSDQAAKLQAFGIISYDDEHSRYRMRAFDDGRFLETDVRLSDDGNGILWGFEIGPVKANSLPPINDRVD